MRKRREQFLKLVCLIFAAVLVLHIARLGAAKPFAQLKVPPLPALPFDAQAQKDGGTNGPAVKADSKAGTNSPGSSAKAEKGTNGATAKESPKKGGTNNLSASSTNSPPTNQIAPGSNILAELANQTNSSPQTNSTPGETNALSTAKPRTDEIAATPRKKSKSGKTNVVSEVQAGTASTNKGNTQGGTNASLAAGANATASTNAAQGGTNAVAAKNARKKGPAGGPGASGGPGKMAELPAEIKDRVDRIVQGEILGQVMRPMPMALLGIAGDTAMLRSPEGQTGLVKEGDSLGTLKLLKIGTNRVLVEVKGEKADAEVEKKELMIFAGLGSESLMPKETKDKKEKKESTEPKKTDETTKKKL